MTLAERWRSKVDATPGHGPWGNCWLWAGARGGKGYGQIVVGRAKRPAHIVAWELATGKKVGRRKLVLHDCAVRLCVRFTHLYRGDRKALAWQRDARGRGRLPDTRGERHGGRKLSARQVRVMRRRVANGATQEGEAQRYGVSQGMVSRIVNKRRWRSV